MKIVPDAVPYTVYSYWWGSEAKGYIWERRRTLQLQILKQLPFELLPLLLLQLLVNFPEFAAEHKLRKTSEILKYYF